MPEFPKLITYSIELPLVESLVSARVALVSTKCLLDRLHDGAF